VEGQPKVDPAGESDPTCDEYANNDHVLAAILRFRTFRLPNWHYGVDSSDSNARYDASDDSWARVKEDAWSIKPIAAMIAKVTRARRRPSGFPTEIDAKAPIRQPSVYTATTVPFQR
jgi:hypothetical protein